MVKLPNTGTNSHCDLFVFVLFCISKIRFSLPVPHKKKQLYNKNYLDSGEGCVFSKKQNDGPDGGSLAG